jgi:hypothetical protein
MNLSKEKSLPGLLLLLTTLVLIASGCSSAPKQWNVKLTKTTPASVRVDLVGVSKLEDAHWRSIKPDEYWKENSPIRKDVENRRKTTKFEENQEFTLSADDPIWQIWARPGLYELMIIAELGGANAANRFDNGPADPRRLILPLKAKDWNAKKNTLEIQINDGQVLPLTPPKD